MENTQNFRYTYSAREAKEVETIRKRYLPREVNKMERLKKLDERAQRAGVIESLVFGVVGSLIFGIGMCFMLSVFGTNPLISIPFLVAGTAVMAPAYFIYKRISARVKERLAPEILKLSEELIGE